MKRDINNYKHGLAHGYQEEYDLKGKLSLRANYKNAKDIGYNEWHYKKQTEYHIR